MSEEFHNNVDKEQKRIDSLDQSEDRQFDIADATSAIFQGVDNFQEKLQQMNVSKEKQTEYLQAISKNLEQITGQEALETIVKVLDTQLKDFESSVDKNEEFKKFVDPYLKQRELRVQIGSNLSDLEDVISNKDLDFYAYAPFLVHMLKDFDDSEWDNSSDREDVLTKTAVSLVAANLRRVKEQLSNCSDIDSMQYKQLLAVYKEDTKIMTEIVGNVGDNYEAPAFRDPELAVEFAAEALSAMTVDEGIAWTKKTMTKLDDNDWQSKGLKAVYGNLAVTCRHILQAKLKNERLTIAQGDTKAVKENASNAIELAKLFTDRGGDIDSDLTSPDWAVGILQDVLGFEDFMGKYFEEQIKDPNSQPNQKLKQKRADVREALLNNKNKLPEGMTKESAEGFLTQLETTNISNIQDYATQYAQLMTVETQIKGEPINEEQITKEVGGLVSGITDKAEAFLDKGDFWEDISQLQEYTGVSYTEQQKEAYDLLKDIQGRGLFDFSDATWSTIAAGGKIAGMIAVGIAVGMATGGAGFAAMSVTANLLATGAIGGTAMTGMYAVMNQQGFDDWGEAGRVYGSEFAMNSLGMGIGKGLSMLRMAKYGDKALAIGKRLTALGAETTIDMTTGFAINIKGMAIQEGISFAESMDNFKNNPMAWGLGLAMAGFGMGMGYRSMKGALKNIDVSKIPDNDLHGIHQSMNRMKSSASLIEGDLVDTGISLKHVFEAENLDDVLKQIPVEKQASFRKNFNDYVEGQKSYTKQIEESYGKQVLENSQLSLSERKVKVEEVLNRNISIEQELALSNAHEIGEGGVGAYSQEAILKKARILDKAGFTKAERRILMEQGIAGRSKLNYGSWEVKRTESLVVSKLGSHDIPPQKWFVNKEGKSIERVEEVISMLIYKLDDVSQRKILDEIALNSDIKKIITSIKNVEDKGKLMLILDDLSGKVSVDVLESLDKKGISLYKKDPSTVYRGMALDFDKEIKSLTKEYDVDFLKSNLLVNRIRNAEGTIVSNKDLHKQLVDEIVEQEGGIKAVAQKHSQSSGKGSVLISVTDAESTALDFVNSYRQKDFGIILELDAPKTKVPVTSEWMENAGVTEMYGEFFPENELFFKGEIPVEKVKHIKVVKAPDGISIEDIEKTINKRIKTLQEIELDKKLTISGKHIELLNAKERRLLAEDLFLSKGDEKYLVHGTNGKALEGIIDSDYLVLPGEKIKTAFTGESGGTTALNKELVSVVGFTHKKSYGLKVVSDYADMASTKFAITGKSIDKKLKRRQETLDWYKKNESKFSGTSESRANYDDIIESNIESLTSLKKLKQHFLELSPEELERHDLLSEIPVVVLGKARKTHGVSSGISGEVAVEKLPVEIIAVPENSLSVVRNMVKKDGVKVISFDDLQEVNVAYRNIEEHFSEKIDELKNLCINAKEKEAISFFHKNFPDEKLFKYHPKRGTKLETPLEQLKVFLGFNSYEKNVYFEQSI